MPLADQLQHLIDTMLDYSELAGNLEAEKPATMAQFWLDTFFVFMYGIAAQIPVLDLRKVPLVILLWRSLRLSVLMKLTPK